MSWRCWLVGVTTVFCIALSAGLAPSVCQAERRQRPGVQELVQAMELIRQSRYDAAIPLLRRAHELGDLRNALWNLGECYRLLGRPRAAIEAYQRFIAHRRTNAEDRAAAERVIEQLEASMARIIIRGNVEGASVEVDGLDEGAVPLTLEVGPGRHVVEVSSPGFTDWSEEVEAIGGVTHELEAQLELRPGTLDVRSEPGGAEVWIDGERRGETPWSGELSGGGHLIELRSEGFRRVQRQIALRPGQSSTVTLELAPLTGTLAVATNAPGATLLVDGEERGQAPFPPLLLEPDRYELQVTADDHGPWEGEVDIVDGTTTRVELELASTEGLHPGWFWSIAAVGISSFATSLLFFALGAEHTEAYEEHAAFIESNRESPLLIAANREAGERELERANSYNTVGVALLLVAAAGVVADFFVGIFTRFRRPEAHFVITLEENEPAESGSSVRTSPTEVTP